MNMITLLNSEIFTLAILPLLIFLARVIDVSLGTMRVIYVSRGKRFLAPLLGFFEILIWLLAIGQIMQNLNNITYYLAYAGGFTMGIFVGIYIEDKLAIGTLSIQIIANKNDHELINCLKAAGYGITTIDAKGANGLVKIIYVVIKRKDAPDVEGIIKKCNPDAFFITEEVRESSKKVFPLTQNDKKSGFSKYFMLKRK